MRRNSSIIGGLKNPSAQSELSDSGIFDLFDQCMYSKSGIWQNKFINTSLNLSSINETNSITVLISVTAGAYPVGTYYFSIEAVSGTITAGDFAIGALSGSFSLTGTYASSSGTISLSTTTDAFTEGSEQFNVTIRSGSVSGTILATTSTITILDTSLTGSATSATFASTTMSSDPGDAAFTALYSGSAIDEANVSVDVGFTFNFLGGTYSRVGINSNSYVVFGISSPATTFTYPYYSFTASSPAFPAIGVCAHPGSSTDENYQFVGYRTVSSGVFQIRWKGGYPYSFTSVNRIWDMTFTSASSTIKLELRTINAKDASGSGSYVVAKNSTTFIGNSAVPTDGTAYNIVTT